MCKENHNLVMTIAWVLLIMLTIHVIATCRQAYDQYRLVNYITDPDQVELNITEEWLN